MGESRRRQQADPLYGKVSRALQDFSAMQQAMFLTKYQEIGRFAAIIDICRDCIPFLTLKALKSPAPENSLFRQVAGEALITALSLYSPQQEAILLHLWDNVSEVHGEITLNVQLRQLSFGPLSLDLSRFPSQSQMGRDDSLAIAQTVLLATSVPMGPVLSIESCSAEQAQVAATAVVHAENHDSAHAGKYVRSEGKDLSSKMERFQPMTSAHIQLTGAIYGSKTQKRGRPSKTS